MLKLRTFRDDCRQLRLDAVDPGLTAFFAGQLEYVKATTYDVLYAELSAFRFFPMSSEAGSGAKTIVWRSWDRVGMAKIIAGYVRDLPRVDVFARENRTPVVSIGASYGWDLQDLRSAMMAGVALDSLKAKAAVEAHNLAINNLAWFGNAAAGIPGLKTLPNVPTVAFPADGAGASRKFSAKTADQVIRDVNGLITTMITDTKNVEKPNVVAMTPGTLADLNSRPRSTLSDTSILSFLRNAWPGITFDSAIELADWDAPGSDAVIAYRRSADKLTLEVPQPYEELPVQPKGLEFEVPTHTRTGGLVNYYPLSIRIGTGA